MAVAGVVAVIVVSDILTAVYDVVAAVVPVDVVFVVVMLPHRFSLDFHAV